MFTKLAVTFMCLVPMANAQMFSPAHNPFAVFQNGLMANDLWGYSSRRNNPSLLPHGLEIMLGDMEMGRQNRRHPLAFSNVLMDHPFSSRRIFDDLPDLLSPLIRRNHRRSPVEHMWRLAFREDGAKNHAQERPTELEKTENVALGESRSKPNRAPQKPTLPNHDSKLSHFNDLYNVNVEENKIDDKKIPASQQMPPKQHDEEQKIKEAKKIQRKAKQEYYRNKQNLNKADRERIEREQLRRSIMEQEFADLIQNAEPSDLQQKREMPSVRGMLEDLGEDIIEL